MCRTCFEIVPEEDKGTFGVWESEGLLLCISETIYCRELACAQNMVHIIFRNIYHQLKW